MEEQEQYQPETVESSEETPEVTGEQVVEETGQVETAEPTAEQPETKTIPLKAAIEERRKRQEAQEEVKFWREVALGNVPNPHATDVSVKPKPEDFSDYDTYVEALADYKAEQAIKRREEARQTLTREQIEQREQQAIQAKAARDAAEARKRYEDFDTVAGQVNLPAPTLKALYESDLGPDIAYYLGKNPAEYERIMELSPTGQIKAIGKLEDRLASKTANPKAKEVKQPTKVETAGNGIPKQTVTLKQLREEAQRTGNWAKYLETGGFIPD